MLRSLLALLTLWFVQTLSDEHTVFISYYWVKYEPRCLQQSPKSCQRLFQRQGSILNIFVTTSSLRPKLNLIHFADVPQDLAFFSLSDFEQCQCMSGLGACVAFVGKQRVEGKLEIVIHLGVTAGLHDLILNYIPSH